MNRLTVKQGVERSYKCMHDVKVRLKFLFTFATGLTLVTFLVARAATTTAVYVGNDTYRYKKVVCAQRCVTSSLGLCIGLWVDDCSLPPKEVTLHDSATGINVFGAYAEPSDTYFFFGCGPEAAQNVLNYFAVPLRINTIREWITTFQDQIFTDQIGTFPDDLRNGVKDLAVDWADGEFAVYRKSYASEFAMAKAVRAQLVKGFPVMVLADSGGHWLTITGIRSRVNEPTSDSDFEYFVSDYGSGGWWSSIDAGLDFPQNFFLGGTKGYNDNTVVMIERTGDMTRIGPPYVFQGQDAGAYEWGDWAPGFWKGVCPNFQAVKGISAAVDSPYCVLNGSCHPKSHAAFCGDTLVDAFKRTGGWHLPNHCRTVDFSSSSVGYSSDWDFGYYKGECAAGEFVAGVAQTTGSALSKILCCEPQVGTIAKNSCAALAINRANAAEAGASFLGANDWDWGYYKAECGPGRYVAGVSRDTGKGGAHAIYCCSP